MSEFLASLDLLFAVWANPQHLIHFGRSLQTQATLIWSYIAFRANFHLAPEWLL